MNPFAFQKATTPEEAVKVVSTTRGAKFLGGGTNLVDLMKDNVERPSVLVNINPLVLDEIELLPDGGLRLGALAHNSDTANHELIKSKYPLISQAILSGASPQLRNMATNGGNLMQRTRCYYFMDTAFSSCNKREPGSGCAAIKGYNRIHAILGASDECIATHPSDFCVALAALGASVQVQGIQGKRTIPFGEFHKLPGKTPQVETTLRPGELITSIDLPVNKFAANSYYLKVRDRESYAFALVSVAAGLEMDGSNIKSAGLALGGVAHKPWRSREAEASLTSKSATVDNFSRAAEIALAGAHGYEHNAFKITLAKASMVRALTLASQGGIE
jgi:xanthine dehydrogenase YagS FAD-binding subunit